MDEASTSGASQQQGSKTEPRVVAFRAVPYASQRPSNGFTKDNELLVGRLAAVGCVSLAAIGERAQHFVQAWSVAGMEGDGGRYPSAVPQVYL